MRPDWKALPPAIVAGLLILGGTLRLWGSSAGTEAGAVLLGGGMVLMGLAVAIMLKDRDRDR